MQPRGLEIVDGLGFLDTAKVCDGLEFHNDLAAEEIGPVGDTQRSPATEHGNRELSHKWDTFELEVYGERSLIGGFKQPRTKLVLDAKGATNDGTSEGIVLLHA